MKKTTIGKLVFSILLAALFITTSQAQTVLTLKEATEIALANNLQVKVGEIDLNETKEKVKETAGGLYPKISATGSYQYYIELPTSLIPASLFGGPAGTYNAGALGTKQTTSGTASLTQQLFNGQLWVGLKAAKVATSVNELSITATKEDIIYNVSSVYFNLQQLDVYLAILNKNLENQLGLINSMKFQLDNGLTNKTNYNRLLVNKESITTKIESAKNSRLKMQNLLNYLMAKDLSNVIVVEQMPTASSLIAIQDKVNLMPELRTDFKTLLAQKKLTELNKQSEKASLLPTLSTTINYGATGYNGDFNPTKYINSKFYPTSAFQLNLNMPLFEGMSRTSRIAQKQYQIEKMNVQIEQKKQNINKEVADAIASYNSSVANLKTTEANKNLSEKIYEDMRLQFRNGLVTLSDVLSVQTDMNNAQNDYTNALLNLRLAELDLKKAKGELMN